MAEGVRLPEISENVTTGEVVKVLVAVGDMIEVDQPIAELETEKAVFEIPSPLRGKITEVLLKPGQMVHVNEVIAYIEAEVAGATAGGPEVAGATTGAPEAAVAIADEPEAAVTTTGELTDSENPQAQKEASIVPQEGESVPGVATPGVATPEAEVSQGAASGVDTTRAPAPGRIVPAAPSVRRLARELGIDISTVSGSGPGGRISAEDVKSRVKKTITEGAPISIPAGIAAEGTVPLPDFNKWGQVRREPLSKVRRITARNMQRAWTTIPHVTQLDKADITELEKLRKKHAGRVEQAGGKLTVTAIMLKAATLALARFPQFNASLDVATNEVIYKSFYHIGVAVDTDRGLLVPVIRDVNKKSVLTLSVELTQMAERARNRKMTPDEMEGGTFTISNLGGIGGSSFTPIIYAPQTAILGVARARYEPVMLKGASEFSARLMLPIVVSYDHRIIDGADGARFLRTICNILEDPFLLILEGGE